MTQVPTQLVFRQVMGPGTRFVIALAGLFCFFPTYDLLIRPGVNVLRPGMLPFWFIALGAMALGLLLLAAAILGITRTLVFDADAAEMRELGAGAFGLRWRRRVDLRELGAPDVRREDDSDRPPRCAVIMSCAGRKHLLRVEAYESETKAQATAQRVAALLRSVSAVP